ncbi:MAG: prepilin-type N-terminal cleavage/methylation domain-containing protein [Ilumatobacter sp.]
MQFKGDDGAYRGDRDDGTTLIEVLISIVLLGIGVAAMLTTLSVTISASATERDHANGHAWLQIASDVVYGIERPDCGVLGQPPDQAGVYGAYNNAVKSAANPEGWADSNIEVVPPVKFWDGTVYQSECYDDKGVALQLIKIQVRNPKGEIVESVEIVKG